MTAKFRVSAQLTKKLTPRIVSKFNVEAFQNESTKYVYGNRLSKKLKKITLTPTATSDLQWEKNQECFVKTAEESLGTRTVSINVPKKSTPWFTPEIKELAQEKRKAYLKYISEPSVEKRSE